MFPEGTRSRGKGILAFKTGAFRLALDNKLKVVPVCASDNHHSIKFNRWNNGKVIIEIMDPVELAQDTPPKQLAKEFEEKIKAKFVQLTEEASADAAAQERK